VNALFYVAAAVAVVATLLAIVQLNAVHALLYLIVSLLSVAVVLYVLGATFVAGLEVIIYAGAIMVLFLFAIMILNLGPQARRQESQWLRASMWWGPILLTAVLLAELLYVFAQGNGQILPVGGTGPKEVGMALFGPYVLGLELASMLLLAGLVGAYHLGRRPQAEESGGA
jgi:NADH-quinone oxidoreductase subunit J